MIFLKPTSPDGRDPHYLRSQNLVRAALPLGVVGHALVALFSAFLSAPLLAGLHGVSSGIYVLLFLTVGRIGFHTAIFVSIVETFVATVVGTYLVGWESGFFLWVIIGIMLPFVGYRWTLLLKIILVCLGLATLAGLNLFMKAWPPVYALDEAIMRICFLGNLVILIGTAAGIMFFFTGTTERAEREAQAAHDETRALLLNILPISIADRLTAGEALIADSIPECTILFSDLAGFTRMSTTMPAEKVVEMLNEIISGFDEIASSMGLEKIKTIGDGYMLAAGAPEPRHNHGVAVINCAIHMLNFIKKFNQDHNAEIRLRIGINSGQVVAGVIGKDKFTYDLWGDTVNTAARMESHGVPGKIQISAATYELVKDVCRVKPRGAIEVKGKGEMRTYLIEGIRKSHFIGLPDPI